MRTVVGNRYIRALENAIPREAHFHSLRPPRGQRMDLRCPNCGSSELKKASLVYEEGLSRIKAKSRLRGVAFGDDGPNVVAGTVATNEIAQTQLSKRLRPPKEWSYLKVIGWSVVVSFVMLIAYVRSIMGSSTRVSSLPAMAGMFVVAIGFVLSLFLIWRHNHLVYPKQHAEWNDSWLCQRCGGVSSQNVA